MAKIRVYELARELKLESKELLAKMKDLDIQVPSHQSTLTAAQIEKIRASLEANKPKVVVRRRRKAAEPAAESSPAAESVSTKETISASKNEKSNPDVSVKISAKPSSESKAKKIEQEAPIAKAVKEIHVKSSQTDTVPEKKLDEKLAKPSREASVTSSKAHTELEQLFSEPKKKPAKTLAEKVSEKVSEVSEVIKTSVKKIDEVLVKKQETEPKADEKISSASKKREEEKKETLAAKTVPMSRSLDLSKVSEFEATPSKKKEAEAEKQETSKKDDLEKKDLAVDEQTTKENVQASEGAPAKKKVASPTESAAVVISKADSASEMQAKVTKKKVFAGATIIRRATVEETEAIKAREVARQRTSRREDSRGVRVTGIGVSPRMGEDQKKQQNSVVKKKPLTKPAASQSAEPNEDRSAYSDKGEGLGSKWGREKGKEKTGRWDSAAEEEKARTAAAAQPKKRISMRDLLARDLDTDDVISPVASKKRRTVYTPSAQQRKRDLKRRKDLKSTVLTTPRAAYRVVKVDGSTIAVSDLARQLSIKSAELIKKLMGQGMMVTVNQAIDFDTASLIATDYGYEIKNVEKTAEDVLGLSNVENNHTMVGRAPIITVMGHVDHGKTSILDAIRQSDVANGEAGGITQHIGAYQVERNGFVCTFLDTPGHAAFSAMRARGAQVTDLVILVVAADDGVMPQTKEAISHAKDAGVPVIVAVNKIDKQNVNFDRIYTELSELGVQAEDWGGDSQFVKVSALKNLGIDELLEAVQIQSEMLELKAPKEGLAEGSIVEAHLDKGRGPVATVMVLKGALKQGDFIVAGTCVGRVRAMTDYKGKRIKIAYPSTPVEVVGLAEVPGSGDSVNAAIDEKTAKDVAELRKKKEDEAKGNKSAAASLEELLNLVKTSETLPLHLIIKSDTQGSLEAIVGSLEKLSSGRVKNVIVHKAVGGINNSDISLSETSGAVILAFNVRASGSCADLAEKKGIVVKYFSVIYDLVDAVKNLMSGKLPPIETEVVQGHAEVRNAINVPRIGTIAGSSVLDGKITRSSHLRLIRDEIVIYAGKIGSLRRFKDDVKEVQNGYECGISIDGYSDVKIGDVIEAYMIEEKAAKLDFGDA